MPFTFVNGIFMVTDEAGWEGGAVYFGNLILADSARLAYDSSLGDLSIETIFSPIDVPKFTIPN